MNLHPNLPNRIRVTTSPPASVRPARSSLRRDIVRCIACAAWSSTTEPRRPPPLHNFCSRARLGSMNHEPRRWLLPALGPSWSGFEGRHPVPSAFSRCNCSCTLFPSTSSASGLVLPLLIFRGLRRGLPYRKHTQVALSVSSFSVDGSRRGAGLLSRFGRISDIVALMDRLEHRLVGGIELLASPVSAPTMMRDISFGRRRRHRRNRRFSHPDRQRCRPLDGDLSVAIAVSWPKMEYVGTVGGEFFSCSLISSRSLHGGSWG